MAGLDLEQPVVVLDLRRGDLGVTLRDVFLDDPVVLPMDRGDLLLQLPLERLQPLVVVPLLAVRPISVVCRQRRLGPGTLCHGLEQVSQQRALVFEVQWFG